MASEEQVPPDVQYEDNVEEGWAYVVVHGHIPYGVFPRRGDAVAAVLMTWPHAEIDPGKAGRNRTEYLVEGNQLWLTHIISITRVPCPAPVAELLVPGVK